MGANPDFRDLFKLLHAHRVEFLVVGAYASIYYTLPRYTKDIDIWINPTKPNAQRVCRALEEFGAPLTGVGIEDFTDRKLIYQIGIEPNRVDILMGLPGLRFPTAWKNRTKSTYCGVAINLLGRKDLIKSKIRAGRPLDLIDAEALRRGTSA